MHTRDAYVGGEGVLLLCTWVCVRMKNRTALDLLDEVMRNYQRREGVSRRDAQVPLQIIRDKISIMEHGEDYGFENGK